MLVITVNDFSAFTVHCGCNKSCMSSDTYCCILSLIQSTDFDIASIKLGLTGFPEKKTIRESNWKCLTDRLQIKHERVLAGVSTPYCLTLRFRATHSDNVKFSILRSFWQRVLWPVFYNKSCFWCRPNAIIFSSDIFRGQPYARVNGLFTVREIPLEGLVLYNSFVSQIQFLHAHKYTEKNVFG